MEALKCHFPLTGTTTPKSYRFSSSSPLKSLPGTANLRSRMVSIRPPPPEYDYYKSETLDDTRSVVEKKHPELMDLVEQGILVVVEKARFGPVPAWRSDFVEPDAIWLVGTSHISEQSAVSVECVVRAVRPDNVVVELCRSRAGIMYHTTDEASSLLKSNMFSLSGVNFFATISRSINLGGQTALALRLLLAIFSSKISTGANWTFGDEFRAARRASEEVGAQIVLGDRPIEITLERAWSNLKWSDKLRLLTSLFYGVTASSAGMSGILKDEEIDGGPFQLYERLSASYPSLLQPLLHERDTYLAWSLKRSKAVNNSKKVVGVIGKGHMNGVVYALVSDQGNLRFRDLAGKNPSGESSYIWINTFLKSLFRDTVLAFIIWALFENLKNMS